MRHFELEKYFSHWEFKAKYHMTASDTESLSVNDVLSLGTVEQRDAFNNLWLGYTETWGAPALLEEIAKTYDSLQPANILTFAGAGEGIYAAMRVLLEPSDHAIVVVPNYQSAETVPLQICQVSGVLLHEENQWRLDMDEVRASIRPTTKLISINFPNNPTGALMPKSDLDELIALCREYGLFLFSDEVYRLTENDPDLRMPQIADVYEKGLSLNVMSKAYGLPGLRVGWVACQDREILQAIERYKHYLSICNSGPSEALSIIALQNRNSLLDRNRALIQSNRALLEQFLHRQQNLMQWTPPQGGCVGFVRYLQDESAEAFCNRLVEEHGVLLLPASLYGSELMHYAPNSFRIGFGRAHFADGLRAFEQALN